VVFATVLLRNRKTEVPDLVNDAVQANKGLSIERIQQDRKNLV
jgi:hypothetical protein